MGSGASGEGGGLGGGLAARLQDVFCGVEGVQQIESGSKQMCPESKGCQEAWHMANNLLAPGAA
jgi:hypothetical protein